jgi:hypothetical protein
VTARSGEALKRAPFIRFACGRYALCLKTCAVGKRSEVGCFERATMRASAERYTTGVSLWNPTSTCTSTDVLAITFPLDFGFFRVVDVKVVRRAAVTHHSGALRYIG